VHTPKPKGSSPCARAPGSSSGGGFAALETAFLLRMRLHDAADIALVSARDHFTFRPNTIYIPFGTDPDSLRFDLGDAARPPRHRG
jgi:sulfide:quinone oxidoreductase